MRLTKIVCTLGPATDTYECVVALIQAGMNVARLNFSHGEHAEHARRIELIRRASKELGVPVGILQDLSGPKIRTGKHASGEAIELQDGQQFTITSDSILGNDQRVSTTYKALPQDVTPGDTILLSDGLIELKVVEESDTDVVCEVIHGGRLRQRQGINLPGVNISAPSVTEKDLKDLAFGLEQGVDFVAISFVRKADDIRQVKAVIAENGDAQPVIAKIERPEALDVLDEILDVTDGIMVARGDLGVEMPPQALPVIQKNLIKAANFRAIPVITATQMFESMIKNPTPTRAEVSDVANAIIDGSDAVMLSGETSIGEHPIDAVRMMASVASAIESSDLAPEATHATQPAWLTHEVRTVPQAIGSAVATICRTLPVDSIWVFTQSGRTARLVSHYRPEQPIIALTPYERVYNRLSLHWGVIPLRSTYFNDDAEFWDQIMPAASRAGYCKPGDTVVVTGGMPLHQHGETNFLKIVTIGED